MENRILPRDIQNNMKGFLIGIRDSVVMTLTYIPATQSTHTVMDSDPEYLPASQSGPDGTQREKV
jgi:hypothetical protein